MINKVLWRAKQGTKERRAPTPKKMHGAPATTTRLSTAGVAVYDPSIGAQSDMKNVIEHLSSLAGSNANIETSLKDIRKDTNRNIETSRSTEALLKTYLEENNQLREDLGKANKKIDRLESQVRDLQLDKHQHMEELRALNIIIRGVPETKGEKMYLLITDIFHAIETTFPYYSATNGAFRLGRVPSHLQVSVAAAGSEVNHANMNNAQKRLPQPRPIKLKLCTKQQKSELFGLQSKLKECKQFGKAAVG